MAKYGGLIQLFKYILNKLKPKGVKGLKNEIKGFLFIANNYRSYESKILFSEQTYMLFRHLFGLGYMLKIFGKVKRIENNMELKQLILSVRQNLMKKPIPKTKWQKMYIQIKKKTIRKTKNILENLEGLQGKPHNIRRLRKMAQRTRLGEYLYQMAKRGRKIQI